MHNITSLPTLVVFLQASSDLTPRAPPNDPERTGNIWQQHERLQADYQQLLAQNAQLASERTHYQNVCSIQAELHTLLRKGINKMLQTLHPTSMHV